MKKSRFGGRANLLAGNLSTAWAVQDEAVARANAGEAIVFLTVGDPDQMTPPRIVDVAVDSLRAGRTHYSPTAGEPALRAAVAGKLSRDTGRFASSEHVIIFPGAQSALFGVVSMLAGPGDEIVVADPYYATYPGVIASSGAQLVAARTSPETGFAFDAAAISESVTNRTKAILFSNPGNPTGATAAASDLESLAKISRQRGIWLIADEVYSNLVYETAHASAWAIGDPHWTVVVNSVSKTYAMTGWRLGWAAGPEDLSAQLTNLAAASQFGCAQFIQDAAARALETEFPEVAAMRDEYQRRRDYVIQRANAIPALKAVRPAGGMFVMLDVRSINSDDVAFAFALLRCAHVAVIPGSGFGPSAMGHVRISLSQPLDVLKRAFDAIEQFVERVPEKRASSRSCAGRRS